MTYLYHRPQVTVLTDLIGSDGRILVKQGDPATAIGLDDSGAVALLELQVNGVQYGALEKDVQFPNNIIEVDFVNRVRK